MKEKLSRVGKYWGNELSGFNGYGAIDLAELREFNLQHPAVMAEWIAKEAEHTFAQVEGYKPSRRDRRNRLRFWLEDKLNIEISKKHFKALD